MQSRRMNLLLLFSRVALEPGEQPLSVARWWNTPLLREEIDRIHLLSPGQLRERYGAETALRLVRLLNRAEEARRELVRYAAEDVYSLVSGDADYPQAMAERLGAGCQGAPLVFFACGDSKLLRRAALGVTGSREPDAALRRLAGETGRHCAQRGLVLCEGGARGVDQISERAALEAGGSCVCFPAVGLRARLSYAPAARAVERGSMLMLSAALPEEGFAAYRALARNHYIAAHAGKLLALGPRDGLGGTWRCASDALKGGWAEVRVWGGPGERALLAMGAKRLDRLPDGTACHTGEGEWA